MTEAVKIATLKYESGESNLLSKVMMESKYEELKLALQQAEADKLTAQQKLMKTLQSDITYEAAPESMEKLQLDYDTDSLASYLENSAIVDYLNEGLVVSGENVKVHALHRFPKAGFWLL
jgi:outer membrane protein TolC